MQQARNRKRRSAYSYVLAVAIGFAVFAMDGLTVNLGAEVFCFTFG